MKVTIELDLSNDIFGEKSDSYIEELFNEMVEDTEGVEVSDISISERPEKKANPNKLTKETFNPDAFKYVDLGLPSGRLWATENAPDYYTHYEAVDIFGKFLPKAVAIAELVEECKWTWNSDKKGYDVVGPNGNSIFLPASATVIVLRVRSTMLAATASIGLLPPIARLTLTTCTSIRAASTR